MTGHLASVEFYWLLFWMANKSKGRKVELYTLLSWEKERIMGYATENVDHRVCVNFRAVQN